MDAVSDVLRLIRLAGAAYLNAEFSAPWCVIGQTDAALCAGYLPPAERVVSYHLVTEGSCWARLADDSSPALQVFAGELLVVPQGEAHVLGRNPELSPVPFGTLLADQLETKPGRVMMLSYGGGGISTRLVCGFWACNETHRNPILAALPRIFKIDIRRGQRSTWLESTLQFAATEAAELRTGSSLIVGRLSELLFIEAIRRYMETLPRDHTGWLAGMRDRFVGRSLSMMHARPAYAWTVDELARSVGLSRSALTQRFTELLGQPPMQYLAGWRLQVAAYELMNSRKPIVAIAEQVGYESEPAFNRAFKREFGLPPAHWRRSHNK